MRASKPLYSKIKTFPLWGFDIETYSDKNLFLMGSIVGEGLKKAFWNKERFIRFIYDKANNVFSRGYIAATNLQFDFMALFDKTDAIKVFSPIIRNSSFLLVKLPIPKRKHILKFIDTLSFCKFSVERWGQILGYKKLEKPAFLGQKPKTKEERLILEEYNLRDSEITYKAIAYLQKGYNNLGGQLKITASSSALDLYRRKFQSCIFWQPKIKDLELLYKGYYGGRTEVIVRGTLHDLNYYDVNSLYPFVMLNQYPKPEFFKAVEKVSFRNIEELEGVCYAELYCPYMYIPYLPMRMNGKLCFPYGQIKGYYTFFELRKCLRLGYEIKVLGEAMLYFGKFQPFKEYVRTLYALRLKQKNEHNPMENLTKLSLNSLYGKFAQKLDINDRIVHHEKVTVDMLENSEFDRSGEYFIFHDKNDNKRVSSFINPILSIYTTAYARDYLFNLITECKRDIYYYDTDSLFTKRPIETGDKLGMLKKEGNIKTAILIKPKMYMLDNKPKVKGLFNIDDEDFFDILSNKFVRLEKFAKFKEANRRGFSYNEKYVIDKHLGLEDDKRFWEGTFSIEKAEESEPIESFINM